MDFVRFQAFCGGYLQLNYLGQLHGALQCCALSKKKQANKEYVGLRYLLSILPRVFCLYSIVEFHAQQRGQMASIETNAIVDMGIASWAKFIAVT